MPLSLRIRERLARLRGWRPTWRAVDIGWRILFTVLVAGALWFAIDAHVDLRRQALANCREIEQVKAAERRAAWIDFNNLDQNVALLGIRKTPQIIDAAKDRRDARLEQYRREPCPRRTNDRRGA